MDFVELSEKLLTEFKHISDSSFLAICIIQNGYVKYQNQKFIEQFGYSEEEILSWRKREFFKVVHPEDQNSFLERLNVIDNKTLTYRIRGITKSKKVICLDCYLSLISYEHKRAYLVTSMKIENNNHKDMILNGNEDLLFHSLEKLNDESIDFFLIGAIKFRNAIARGESLHFFEKKIAQIERILLKIKEKRLLGM